jgi:parvulin-like peptidyl-prolyl isomerase
MVGAMALRNRQEADKSLVRARHILIAFDKTDGVAKERALKQITDLRARIVDGESFAKLASDYSQDPLSARRGGDLNYAERGVYSDAFELYCWTGPVGELSDVVETGHGYHLIRVEDRIVSDVDRVVMEEERAVHEELNQQQQGNAEEVPTP